MKNKRILVLIGGLGLLLIVGLAVYREEMGGSKGSKTEPTTTTKVQYVNSTITADGSVTAQSQAKLNFQTQGRLVYLPFKEGDNIQIGQTVAKLDTYTLQRQLTAALDTYRTTRNTFEQTQENSQDNVLRPQVAAGFTNVNIDSTTVINTAIARILEQNQANLDSSVINVELANYALQLSTLTSPINGIVTHEDVQVPGINITPATTFTVADPDTMVFRANVPAASIYYVATGNKVTLAVDGIENKITGTVVKIYPAKVVLANGAAVYQVDIESDELKKNAKLDEAGKAIISTNSENVALVPAWTVLGGKYIWVLNNQKPELRQITAGKVHGTEIEITNGLSPSDKILVDPKFISALKYKLL
jgi:HlyD family secretion protein